MAFRVKNWQSFQHYKDRSPPWIKLHRTLLDNREWHELSGDASKLLAECWLLASESADGSIGLSAADLAWRLRRDPKKCAAWLQELVAKGFLESCGRDASTMLATCSPETEGETETDIPSTTEAPPPVEPEPEIPLTAELAPLIRQHLWRGPTPPAACLRKNPAWGMGNELSIAKQLVAKWGRIEIRNALPHFHEAMEKPPSEPISLLYVNTQGRWDVVNRAVEMGERDVTPDQVVARIAAGRRAS